MSPRAEPAALLTASVPLTVTSHSPPRPSDQETDAGPTVPPFVLVSVICWPTIGASCYRKRGRTARGWPGQSGRTEHVRAVETEEVSTEPSWRKPKPRTCGPRFPLLPLRNPATAGMRTCRPSGTRSGVGILKSCVSARNWTFLGAEESRGWVERVAAVTGADAVGIGDVEVEIVPRLLGRGERVSRLRIGFGAASPGG